MRCLLARLLRRHPPGFPHRIAARFDGTLVYEGAIRTGADLFGKGGGQPLPALVYHRFLFEHAGKPCYFLVRDDARAMRFAPGERIRAHLDAGGDRTLFREQESRVLPVEPPSDDDDANEGEDA